MIGKSKDERNQVVTHNPHISSSRTLQRNLRRRWSLVKRHPKQSSKGNISTPLDLATFKPYKSYQPRRNIVCVSCVGDFIAYIISEGIQNHMRQIF